jgi:transposase
MIQLETLEPEVANYIRQLEKRQRELEIFEHKYLIIKERYDLLVYQKFARSAEQLLKDKNQLSLFEEAEQENDVAEKTEAQVETQKVKAHTRKKAGRKPIDPNIPRKDQIIDIPEEEKVCACGEKMTRIGEEASEKLEITPPSMFVIRIIRLKYACRCCEGTADENEPAVKIAPVPPALIPRSIASASLLSYIMIQKFQDHLPYYRQETQFERIGIEISRQDMSNWQQHVYRRLEPLFCIMKKVLSSGPVLQMDETTVQVMGEVGRADTQKSYMWLARGGPPGKTIVSYVYCPTRKTQHAVELLKDFTGYLQTDGYDAYDAAVKVLPDIIHVGCFAHARRKFFEASKVTKKPQTAEEGIKHIRKLYTIERTLREEKLEESDFLAKRKEQIEPVLAEFKAWLEKLSGEVLPSALLGTAVSYTLSQWDKLIKYLESPYLTPDNNACENAIRPFVLGRKNWLFSKSPKGAESSCGIYSLIETAKQNGIEPLKYLRELFDKAPLASSPEDWEKLLPWNIFNP